MKKLLIFILTFSIYNLVAMKSDRKKTTSRSLALLCHGMEEACQMKQLISSGKLPNIYAADDDNLEGIYDSIRVEVVHCGRSKCEKCIAAFDSDDESTNLQELQEQSN